MFAFLDISNISNINLFPCHRPHYFYGLVASGHTKIEKSRCCEECDSTLHISPRLAVIFEKKKRNYSMLRIFVVDHMLLTNGSTNDPIEFIPIDYYEEQYRSCASRAD